MPPPTPSIADEAPKTQAITAYDRVHHRTYLRLLDADTAGADWREAARDILSLDCSGDPERARRIWQSHLDRARWMTTTGFRLLLGRATGEPSAKP